MKDDEQTFSEQVKGEIMNTVHGLKIHILAFILGACAPPSPSQNSEEDWSVYLFITSHLLIVIPPSCHSRWKEKREQTEAGAASSSTSPTTQPSPSPSLIASGLRLEAGVENSTTVR